MIFHILFYTNGCVFAGSLLLSCYLITIYTPYNKTSNHCGLFLLGFKVKGYYQSKVFCVGPIHYLTLLFTCALLLSSDKGYTVENDLFDLACLPQGVTQLSSTTQTESMLGGFAS